MVQLELRKMIAISVDDMSEQDLEQWYEEVAATECGQLDFDLDRQQCENMFNIFRRILMYKGEQVDSLMTEIEDLATKQGEEEAKRFKIQEETKTINVDDLSQSEQIELIRKELTRLELENERLSSDVQQQKQEVDGKVKELDKITAQLSKVENERDLLRRELDAVQDEIAERQLDEHPVQDDLTMAERFRDLTESVRQKNQHITQLLNDIEVSEKENKMLRQMLANMRDELQNATVHLNTLSAEIGNMKCLQDEYLDRIKALELNDKGLRSQISELVAEKEKCEEQIDELGEELESRIKQLTELLLRKDEEITNFKSRIGSVDSVENQNAYLAKLQETVARQEDQIIEFQKQVQQATNDLNRSATALERQKKLYNELLTKKNESPELKILEKKLSEVQEELKMVLDKNKRAEEDATEKAEKISKLIIRVREFESGEYGLEEATEEVRKLKLELGTRDSQIEELVHSSNRLHQEADLLEQDNLAMKEKLGLSVDDVVRPKGMMARHKEAQTKITTLQKELDECKEVIVNLKLKNRSLSKSTDSVKLIALEGEGHTDEDHIQSEVSKQVIDIGSELEDNVKELIEENESLRKGMHEILDSVHNQDGLSVVRIECQSLERLLEAMDARHVAGWYQPGMRLLARINNLEGVNSNLRHQLHSLHDALTETKEELINTQKEVKLKKCNVNEEVKEDEYPDTFKELQNEREKYFRLEEEVKLFQNKFQQLKDEMKLMSDEYDNEKQKMKSLVDKLELELKINCNKEIDLRERFVELEKSWNTMLEDPDQIKRQLSYNVIKVTGLTEELQVTKRMYQCCFETEQNLKKEKQKAIEDVWTIKAAFSNEVEKLLKIQEQQNNELKKMNDQVKNSVNLSDYKALKHDFEVLTTKHREILHLVLFKEDTLKLAVERLMAEVTLLKDQRQNFVIEVAKFFETDDELTLVKTENVICKQRVEHSEKMYSLLKNQMEEMETRCKSLEKNLCDMLDANLQCQTEEVRLRETTVNMVDESEYDKIAEKLKDAQNSLEEATEERSRLLKILEIAQSQVCDLEQHHKRLDHQHDVMHRRVIELQALSDEKATIDKLMREIANHEVNQMAAVVEETKLKNIIQDQQAIIAGLECKSDRILEQHDSITERYRIKNMRLEKIIFELQKRYHGVIPLVSEQIWVQHKQKLEEALTITHRKWLYENEPNHVDEIVFIPTKATEDYRSKYIELQLKELKVQLTCDDLQKKNQLLSERIEKQDCFIESLEKEVIRMDSDCMHNYLSWTIQDFCNDAKAQSKKKVDKQISVQSENNFKTLERKLEDLDRQLKLADKNILTEKENSDSVIAKLQMTLTKLEDTKVRLEKEIIEKDDHIRKLAIELAANDIPQINTPNPALLATIDSLETIISQKEETINRLQELLKECREEHTKEIIELQKIAKAHNFDVREKQPKDVSSPIHANNIKSVVNQYMLRITDLEDRLKQAEDELNQANSEKEHWSGVAERRLKEMEQMKSEDDSKEKDAEIFRLNEIIMGFQNRRDTLPTQRDRLRVEVDKMKKKLNEYERREKEDKFELQKLRQQLIYRPTTGGKRDEVMSVDKEELLTKKIKTLEMQLDEYKKKDDQYKLLRKLKSDEHVGKWEMKKRRQVTNERLQKQLLEITRECDSLRLNNQRLRDNLMRMEKDRNSLEMKLKSANALAQSSALANSLVDELTLEKSRLSDELYTLRTAKEMMSGGSSLAEVVVDLRRKISSLELLQKGGSNALIKELDALKNTKIRLMKTQTALEEENAQLKKIVDRLQCTDNLSGLSSLSSDSDCPVTDKQRTAKLERLVIMLRTAVEKLKEENKNLSLERVVTNTDDKSYVEKLQSELQSTQSYYLDASEKCSQLEQQLLDYRSQYESVFIENENLKNQLEKKCYLLSKTKTMLEKAAAREQLIMDPNRPRIINNTTFID